MFRFRIAKFTQCIIYNHVTQQFRKSHGACSPVWNYVINHVIALFADPVKRDILIRKIYYTNFYFFYDENKGTTNAQLGRGKADSMIHKCENSQKFIQKQDVLSM